MYFLSNASVTASSLDKGRMALTSDQKAKVRTSVFNICLPCTGYGM